jgi:UDP-N-acetylmuramate--alanine ligase
MIQSLCKPFIKRVHFLGIGGAGMSPLAELMCKQGYEVTGSDRSQSSASKNLEKCGIRIQYSHVPDLISDADLVVYSSAVREDNPERVYSKEHGIRMMRRADFLGEIMRMYFTVCIAGTHGKTTTTSLTGNILMDAGMDPTVLVGGMLKEKESHAVIGKSTLLIAEADEYDRSFLVMYPTIAIITNVDADHLECYGTYDAICDAFVEFTKKVPFYGAVIACCDDPGVRRILPRIEARTITYGLEDTADFRATDIQYVQGIPRFNVLFKGKNLGNVQLGIPGVHNVLNALAAIACAAEMDTPVEKIASGLSSFTGVRRRFEIISNYNGITVVDDYAHHPNEIKATLAAARKCSYSRVIAVFQPHLYSRTIQFMDDFAEVLQAADVVFVTEIYKAREDVVPGVTAATIVKQINKVANGTATFIPELKNIPSTLKEIVKDGDGVIFMGAGDIWECAVALKEVVENG